MTRWSVNSRLRILGLGQQLGREATLDDVEPLTWAMASFSDGLAAVDYALAMQASVGFTRRLGQFWESYDLLLTPTLGGPPPLVGALEPPPDDPMAKQRDVAALVPFTTHFNVTGQPAISLPLHTNSSGLPIGVQLVAAYGREDLLLQIAAQLEEAAPWAGRQPSV
jgi:amidase